MSVAQIDIGRDFSAHVGPRYRKDGAKSGEEFFQDVLEPAFRANDSVVIDLDGVEGYSASFFEEAFGGLVRKYGYENVVQKVRFLAAKRGYLATKIETWMRLASDGRGSPASR